MLILQLHGEQWKPAAFCSRRLTEAETHCAQIEKESLSGVWECVKVNRYLCVLEQFKLVSDHSRLSPSSITAAWTVYPYMIKVFLKLMTFNPIAEYAPEKTLIIADTLLIGRDVETDSHSEVACYVVGVVQSVGSWYSPTCT